MTTPRRTLGAITLSAGLLFSTVAQADPSPTGAARSEPVGDLNPTVATRRLLHQVASGAWPVTRFLDPTHGLLLIHDPAGEGKKSAKRLCGAELAKKLKVLMGDLEGRLKSLDGEYKDERQYECANKPPPASCTLPGLEEGDESSTLVFSLDPAKGLMLDAWVLLDCCGLNSDAVDRQQKWVASEQKRLAATSCPAAEAAPPKDADPKK